MEEKKLERHVCGLYFVSFASMIAKIESMPA